MKRNEIRGLLIRSGFALHRHGTRHELWAHPSGLIVPVSRGKGADPRSIKNTRALLRRNGIEVP